MDDQDVQKIIIVTQTPTAFNKHPGGDRTGNFISRPKMTTDIAAAINDGLYFYEQVCVCVCVCAFSHALHDWNYYVAYAILL